MSEKKEIKKMDITGKIEEKELQELADSDATGAATPAVAITIAVSAAFCPTIKCTSKC